MLLQKSITNSFQINSEDFNAATKDTDIFGMGSSPANKLKIKPVDDLTAFVTGQGFSPEVAKSAQELTNIENTLFPGDVMDKRDALQAALVNNNQSFISQAPKSGIDKFYDIVKNPAVYGPALSAGIPAALTYAMSDDEELTEDQLSALTDPQRAAYDQFKAGRAANPNFAQTPEGQALLSRAGITSSRTAAQLARSTGVPLSQAEAFQKRRYGIVSAAGGGEIIGPGSGTSDSIPAMLSDGEFVMTAEAVRNAGKGDRDLGAARMYDMMNKFERAV